MEQVNLTTPVSNYQIRMLHLDWAGSVIHIVLGISGIETSFVYTGDEARNLMVALNKVDLSVKSLHRRILEKLIADGKLVGTISGTPD